MPRYTENVIKRGAYQGPGEIHTFPEEFALAHDRIELARYAGKRRGGRDCQSVHQFLLTVSGDPFRPHGRGIADAFILGVPAGLMGCQIGFGLRADIGEGEIVAELVPDLALPPDGESGVFLRQMDFRARKANSIDQLGLKALLLLA
jgi:hypothetical protein